MHPPPCSKGAGGSSPQLITLGTKSDHPHPSGAQSHSSTTPFMPQYLEHVYIYGIWSVSFSSLATDTEEDRLPFNRPSSTGEYPLPTLCWVVSYFKCWLPLQQLMLQLSCNKSGSDDNTCIGSTTPMSQLGTCSINVSRTLQEILRIQNSSHHLSRPHVT